MTNKYVDEIMRAHNTCLIGEGEHAYFLETVEKQIRKAQLDVLERVWSPNPDEFRENVRIEINRLGEVQRDD